MPDRLAILLAAAAYRTGRPHVDGLHRGESGCGNH